MPDGRELVMQTGAEAKFKDQYIRDFSYRFLTEGVRSNPGLGLFRMWTFTGADGFLFPESINRNYDLNNYPLTKKWIHVPGVEILPFKCDEYSGE